MCILKFSLLSIVVLVTSFTLFGSSADWVTYDKNNSGFPADAVQTFDIDADDVKWFGTFSSGVVKFDGTRWKTFDTSDTKLPVNWVQAIGVGAGTKWFHSWGFTDPGLSKFDGTTWTAVPVDSNGWKGIQMRTIYNDKNNVTWFGTTENGLIKYDGVSWTYYTKENSSLPSNAVIAIGRTNEALYLGTDSGLVKFDGTTFTNCTSASGLISKKIVDNGLVFQKNGTIWIATADSGIYSFNGTSTWNHFDNTTQPDLYFYNNMAVAIAIDSVQHVWASTGMGLVEYDGSIWKKFTVMADEESATYFPGASVTKIAVESNGRKWFLTSSEGIITDKLSTANKNIYSTKTPKNMAISITKTADKHILTFVISGNSDAKTLVIYTPDGRLISRLNVNQNLQSGKLTATWNTTDAVGTKAAFGRYIVGAVDKSGKRIAVKGEYVTIVK